MLTCQWCGTTYEDAGSIDSTDNGFWCELCDGFTFYNKSEYERRRLLLLLEDKQAKDISHFPSSPLPRLCKQLSPLRYPGGKSRLIDYLYSRLCQEQMDTFIEVFAGGASLGLSLLDAGIIKHLILNDKDPSVYAFWHTILNHPQELISRLQGDFPTHDDLAAAKEYLSVTSDPTPELAWSFLLANRLSYSGIIKANPQGGKNGSNKALLARWNPQKLVKRILHIHSMAEHIELFNEDACTFLEEDAWWGRDNKGLTLFLDPPYTTGASFYALSFTEHDHRNLADLVQTLYCEFPWADVIITYDNHPFIRSLYPLATQEIIGRRYSI